MKSRYTKSFIASSLLFLAASSYSVTSDDMYKLGFYIGKLREYLHTIEILINNSDPVIDNAPNKYQIIGAYHIDKYFVDSCCDYIYQNFDCVSDTDDENDYENQLFKQLTKRSQSIFIKYWIRCQQLGIPL